MFAWDRHTAADQWELVGNLTVPPGHNRSNPYYVVFQSTYICDDIDPDVLYKFNASNADGTTNTNTQYFAIREDYVDVKNVTPIYNATVNRSQTTPFVIIVNDTDIGSPPSQAAQGKIWITTYERSSF